MIGRVLLAALLAGIAAGLFMGVIQQTRLTPLILEAEKHEVVDTGHLHATGTVEHAHEDAAWVPGDGWERTAYTYVTAAITGAGFATLLTGVAFVLGLPITRVNGVFWGLCGFLAVSLAPAAGLPPELPGMPAAPLNARILWWLMTIAFTSTALWIVVTRREYWLMVIAVLLVLAPHMVGAPQAQSHQTDVPLHIYAAFVTSSLAANALFWSLIGTFLGYSLDYLERGNTS
jgi:cobalt transporter subunit CbtA